MSVPALERPSLHDAAAARLTQEIPTLSAELGMALVHDHEDLRREVLLWQRSIRYLALATLVLVWLVFGPVVQRGILPVAMLCVAYVTCVMTSSWLLERATQRESFRWVPALLLTADLLAIAGFCYFTGAPEQQDRVLLLGLMSVQLSTFYFGWRLGTYGSALTLIAYAIVTLGASPFVQGPRPAALMVGLDITLFGIVSAVLISTFGRFRQRLDALRMFCKIVEQGEAARVPRIGDERRPDDLTLLARSFDAMRIRLAEQLGTDPLTGCLNRRALETRLATEMRHARRRNGNVGLAAIDLDNFKTINDTMGHPTGDLVLQQLAQIMKNTARDTDAVARLGGDEFLIVLPDAGWPGALSFAERLRHNVEHAHFGAQRDTLTVTISVGMAMASGTDAMTPHSLMERADQALYKAKTEGRNRVSA